MTFKKLKARTSATNYALVSINGITHREYTISDLPGKYLNTKKTAELDALYNKKAGLVYIIH